MTRYLSLAEYLWLAEQVTGVKAEVLSKVASIDLADSALHAPSASFGGQEFYPDAIDKAAVLVCRLAWNHPLPDGNKRAAWGALVLFLDAVSLLPRSADRCLHLDGYELRGPELTKLSSQPSPCTSRIW